MILVDGVSKDYGKVRAVRDVSLDVGDGSRIAVQGPSGSGKTTLLRLIAGLEVPDAGEIRFDGEVASTPSRTLPPHERNLGFMFQEPTLWPHLNVTENILFGLASVPKTLARDRTTELLERLHLEELAYRYPAEISGGEAKRVAIARALAPRPRHLLLDEPSTYLEPELRAEVLALILGMADESGAALLLVTHDPVEARTVSERVMEMRNGVIALA